MKDNAALKNAMHDKSSREVETDAHQRRLWFRENILPREVELRRYVRRIGRGRISVDDLVHDTLVRIMTASNWRQITQPAAFMRTTARNLLTDAMRREKVVSFELLSEPDEMAADEAPDQERSAIGRDDLRRLMSIVETLPPQQRRVLLLRKVHDVGLEDIALQLDLSVSTVEKHLVRALRFCSERLARDED